MKNLLVLIALVFAFEFQGYTTDLIVEEFGTLPTYSSINAAMTASANGDRIIIKNRAGDIPWIENLTVSKSLTFLSYTNNTQWIMQGTITIDKATGREVNIIGMKNTSGSILEGTGTGAVRGTDVSIMDCWLVAGSISLNNTYLDVQLISNKIDNGQVLFYYGNLIGNDISYSSHPAISILPGSVTFQGDTCFIVGNKILTSSNSTSAVGLSVNTSGQVLHIKNNYIQHKGNGILLGLGNSVAIPNYITNNTIVCNSTSNTNYGIYFNTSNTGSVWEIMNNIFEENASGTAYGLVWGGSGQCNVYYNFFDSSFSSALGAGSTVTFQGNNTTNQTFTINTDGTLPVGNPGLNGGNPSQPYYDLDLSVGDVGAYGGSYTLFNFHPLFTGAARVYFVKFPFNVRQGSTLSVKAFGYDR